MKLTIEGAGHAVLWENNDVVMDAIRSFTGGGWPDGAEIIR